MDKKFDRVVTVEATTSFDAREIANQMYPECWAYSTKSWVGHQKRTQLLAGRPTAYTVYMLKRVDYHAKDVL